MTLRQIFICLRPPPLLGNVLRWESNFAGSKSGHIQSVKVLQYLISITTLLPPAVCMHILSHRGVELEKMPLNIFRSKLQEKITNELAYSFLYRWGQGGLQAVS
jgi:hypothetical protein